MMQVFSINMQLNCFNAPNVRFGFFCCILWLATFFMEGDTHCFKLDLIFYLWDYYDTHYLKFNLGFFYMEAVLTLVTSLSFYILFFVHCSFEYIGFNKKMFGVEWKTPPITIQDESLWVLVGVIIITFLIFLLRGGGFLCNICLMNIYLCLSS